jgi:hypothetical protein
MELLKIMFRASFQSALFVVIVLELAGCGGGNGIGTGTIQTTAMNGATQTVVTPSFTNDGAVLAARDCHRLVDFF